jgi:hypothetical protein
MRARPGADFTTVRARRSGVFSALNWARARSSTDVGVRSGTQAFSGVAIVPAGSRLWMAFAMSTGDAVDCGVMDF